MTAEAWRWDSVWVIWVGEGREAQRQTDQLRPPASEREVTEQNVNFTADFRNTLKLKADSFAIILSHPVQDMQ